MSVGYDGVVTQGVGMLCGSTTMIDISVDFANASHYDAPERMPGGPGVGMQRGSVNIDLGVNLANASHFDVNDALQGFSIWTEDEPVTSSDWNE